MLRQHAHQLLPHAVLAVGVPHRVVQLRQIVARGHRVLVRLSQALGARLDAALVQGFGLLVQTCARGPSCPLHIPGTMGPRIEQFSR